MAEPLRILLLEDSEPDAELLLRALRQGGLEFVAERVDTAEGLAAALKEAPCHAVIADYTMPGFTALDALQMLHERQLDLPFLIVSGTIGETVAVEAMRAGAHDYLMKDNLTRLVPAVKRELREAAHRRQRRTTEEELAASAEARKRYEFIANTSRDFMSLINTHYIYEAINEAYCAAMQLSREEILGKTVSDIWGPETFQNVIRDRLAHCLDGHDVQYEEWFKFGALGLRYVHVCYYPYRGRNGAVTHAVVVSRDITERKRMEDELAQHRDRLAKLVEERTAELNRTTTHLGQLRRQLRRYQSVGSIVGRSPEMLRLFDTIRDVGEVNVPVLIQGESGTGKELVAGAIHGESPRASDPFVVVNCGALPEGVLESELFGHVRGAFTGAVRDRKGRFELADGGTIFLDEVGDLPPSMQVKLLRVLQEGTFEPVGGEQTVKVDVRVISATNKDLREEVTAGRFREDLFYRLAVVPVSVPPLRERREDIALLADHVLKKTLASMGRKDVEFTDEALEAMMRYRWPGNVRELENAIQYAMVRCKAGPLRADHLPPVVWQTTPDAIGPAGGTRRKLSAESVRRALTETKGNKVQAARLLGVSRATLYRFLDDNDLGSPP